MEIARKPPKDLIYYTKVGKSTTRFIDVSLKCIGTLDTPLLSGIKASGRIFFATLQLCRRKTAKKTGNFKEYKLRLKQAKHLIALVGYPALYILSNASHSQTATTICVQIEWSLFLARKTARVAEIIWCGCAIQKLHQKQGKKTKEAPPKAKTKWSAQQKLSYESSKAAIKAAKLVFSILSRVAAPAPHLISWKTLSRLSTLAAYPLKCIKTARKGPKAIQNLLCRRARKGLYSGRS